MSYIEPFEFVFTNDQKGGINTGGITVNSVMLKTGISPIMTLNNNGNQTGGKVSDLFDNMVVPNWAFKHENFKHSLIDERNKHNDDDSDEDSVINGELHDKLLGLIEEDDKKIKKNKNTRKGGKNVVKNKTKKLTRT